MARISAKNCGILIDGRDVSGRSNNASLSITQEAPEVTCFTESTRGRVSGGLGDAELSVDGFYDESASSVDSIYSDYLSASGWVGLFPQGPTACNVGYEFTGIITEYSPSFAVADAAATSLTISSSPPLIRSKVLLAMTGVSATSAAGNGVDFVTAASDAYATLRYTWGAGGSPNISGCLQDSTDDATWVTKAVFAEQITANTKEIVRTGSLARYRRFKYLVTSGSVTFVASVGSKLFN